MMNNRITKIIANTIGLAAVAALGITVYQLGTTPLKEEIPQEMEAEEIPQQNDGDEILDEEIPMVDAGTSEVEAQMDDSEAMAEDEADDSGDSASESSADVQGTYGDINLDPESEETQDVSAAALTLPEVNFSEDTLMEWPVNGNILLDYSMDQTIYYPTLDQYRLSPAIAVQAVEGAPVMSAVNGTVYSIEQDVKTGTTVTMELGNGYQAIYGQLTDLAVSEGDTIKKGTIIGYIGQPTKYYSTEGTNLYFAMKKDGEPIDPIAYLP